MNLFNLFFLPWDTFPELRELPRHLRQAVYQEAARRAMRKTLGYRALFAAAATIPFVICTFGGPYLRLAYGLWMFAVVVVAVTWHRRSCRREMAAVLTERGLRPLNCIICSYHLRGATSDTCPECGEPLAPADMEDDDVTEGTPAATEEPHSP